MPKTLHGMQSIWMLRHDIGVSARFDQYLARSPELGGRNQEERDAAFEDLRVEMGCPYPEDMVLPDDFLRVRLALPKDGFSPDYFSYGSDDFCSRRAREAMDLPEGAAQFMPVDLVAGGEQARGQEYQLMRVLAHQPALDMERSIYTLSDWPDRPGGQRRRARWVDRCVILEDLQPLTEIFRADETYAMVLVTDALAERVLRAGCTGMEFRDPTLPQHGDRLVRYRTATGVAERWV